MKKWLCCILLLVLVAACAWAVADDDAPTLTFMENGRVNYKPIISGSHKGFEVDSWLQQLYFENEDYFWEADPEGPQYTITQTDGSKIKTHIDSDRVLRMDSTLSKAGKVTFKLKATWAGQTAEAKLYIKFYKSSLPKTIGFEDSYTIYTGETLRLDSEFNNGNWKYRKWRGLYPQKVSNSKILDVWAAEYTSNDGAATFIRGMKAGTATVKVQANQDGLNWYKTVKITVVDATDSQGNKYFLNSNKTATLRKGTKKAANVKIPGSIKVGGKTYKVTEIAKNAFSGNSKLTSLTIGSNVSHIGSKAFYNCKKLAKISVKTKKLKAGSIGADAFKNIVKKAVFKCPSSELAKSYKSLFISAGASSKITCKKK